MGRLLHSLFARRAKSDYDWERPDDPAEAEAAIEDAERFVEAARDWLASRSAS